MIGLKMKNLVVLLLPLVALTLAESDETNSIATRDPKLILNPFGMFGAPQCQVTDNGDTGICHGELECVSLAGTVPWPLQFCSGLLGLCCVFNRNCNMRTSQEVSYFKNPNHPKSNYNLPECIFTVIRRSDKFCSLRIEAATEDLPQNEQNCGFTFLTISTGVNNHKLTFCKNSALSQVIDMSGVQKVFLKVKSTTPIQASFKVKVTQVPCSGEEGTSGIDVGTTGTIGSKPIVLPQPIVTAPPAVIAPAVTPRPTTIPTPRPTPPPAPVVIPVVTENILPPAPPVQCGVKGQARRNAVENPHKRQVLAKDNPFLSDLEFPRTHTNDSLFHFWAGPSSLIDVRVTHGETTAKWEYPWQIAMFIGSRYHCGGSIIDDRHILTAAHCVDRYKNNFGNIKLSLGDFDLSNQNDGPYKEARVGKVTVHERYSRLTLQNDIAILRLKEPIAFNNRIKPVCLPNSGLQTNGIQATVTGWGRDEHKRLKSKLQKHESTVLTNTACGAQWVAKKAPANFIVPTMLCMDASKGDSCNGDSGGPLVHQSGGSWVQVGLVSFGSGSCTDANLAGVYTRVSEFVDWIKNVQRVNNRG